MSARPVLAVSNLVAGYHGSVVVRGFDLAVTRGEIVAVLGRNGVGKSTASAAIAGSIAVDAGAICLHGTDVSRWDAAARYRAGLRSMRQTRPVFGELSVADNLATVGAETRTAAGLFAFLAGRHRQPAGTLSGGEQKMLALARTSLSGGSVWILDEPTEGLQPDNVARCAALIEAAAARGVGVVLIEQNVDMALSIADRWIVLERGAMVDAADVDGTSRGRVVRHLTVRDPGDDAADEPEGEHR